MNVDQANKHIETAQKILKAIDNNINAANAAESKISITINQAYELENIIQDYVAMIRGSEVVIKYS